MSPVRDVQVCVDRGGTFTDVFACTDDGRTVCLKLLSEDPSHYVDAPTEGIRRALKALEDRTDSTGITECTDGRGGKVDTSRLRSIRMGTTVGTNALLERKGHRTAFCTTKGFRDLLFIGNQARPSLFDLQVRRPPPLYECAVEVEERVILAMTGQKGEKEEKNKKEKDEEKKKEKEKEEEEDAEVEVPLDCEAFRPTLQNLLDTGVTSLAVVLMHSPTHPEHERQLADFARRMGFRHVSASSALVPMIRIVPRGHTAVVDAYLTPVIQDYLSTFLAGFDEGLADVSVTFMQSDGGLTPSDSFSGYKAILSGPAGGVVGYALTTYGVETDLPVIGFDMGGTSTDVSRYDGTFEHVLETQTAGVTIQAPQLDINTVAAGGGSKLHFQAGVFKVGPDSVGAHPGPACYRKGGQLAVTDANVLLGRVLPDFFPAIFGPSENEPLDVDASRAAFKSLTNFINDNRQQEDASVRPMTEEQVALGFLAVANEEMCRAIRQLTEMKGYEPSRHVLSCFGGAGPQHGCAIARELRIGTVLVHRYSGILSAYGMGLADVASETQEPLSCVFSPTHRPMVEQRAVKLVERVREDLRRQGFKEEDIETTVFLNLRYEGTDTSIMTSEPPDGDYLTAFVKSFRREYGFELRGREVWLEDVRVRGIGLSRVGRQAPLEKVSEEAKGEATSYLCYFHTGWFNTPVYLLEKLGYGHVLNGPVIIMNGSSTIVVEPGCQAAITSHGNVRIDIGPHPPSLSPSTEGGEKGEGQNTGCGDKEGEKESGGEAKMDVVQLSIFSNRFMGIAEQMGRTLQRTSISTNIKERLDFSCALFSADGGLVANAPHVPVHLGAMASTVRWQLDYWSDRLVAGDVLASNHPCAGGSHLPDVTVVTPAFHRGVRVFTVASRGHHAEIGGSTPGSMPPFSKTLAEEGAAFKSFKLVQNGVFQEEGIRKILTEEREGEGGEGKIPGSRRVEDNISDLQAQVAANQRGILLIGELIQQYGLEVVQDYMGYVQANAESAVRSMLRRVAREAIVRLPGCHVAGSEGCHVALEAEDSMDDGSLIRLSLTIDGEKGEAVFDFTGTSPEVYGNWNAPEAVTTAAVIYCLRCLVAEDIPLNQGCLAPVRLVVPRGCFLRPSELAAVVGGNVLTSQRVTDVVLAAFHACACSQGDMNNLTFGDASFGYYETIGGGCGAGASWHGTDAVQCHMTNTRITDPEILERRYPVILRRFGVREKSGGEGEFRGGDGIVREIEFRRPITVSILSERRVHAPHGMEGGLDGKRGINMLKRRDGREINLGGKNTVKVQKGEVLKIMTPGGGGWGTPSGK